MHIYIYTYTYIYIYVHMYKLPLYRQHKFLQALGATLQVEVQTEASFCTWGFSVDHWEYLLTFRVVSAPS